MRRRPALGAAVLMAFMLYFLKKVDTARGTVKTTKGNIITPVEQVLGIFLFPMVAMGICALLYNKSEVFEKGFDFLQMGGIGAHTEGKEFIKRNARMMLFNLVIGFTAYFLLLYGLKYLSTLLVSILGNTLPIFGFFIAFALIHKFKMPLLNFSVELAGIAIIIVGTILVAHLPS